MSSLTQADLNQLQARIDAGDRAGFYILYYNLTGSEQALTQESMSIWIRRFVVLAVSIQLLLAASVAVARAQQITLGIEKAEATRSRDGSAAIIMYLSTDSRRAFADFTSAYVGRFMEILFSNEVLTRARLLSSIDGGKLQIGGKFNDSGAADLARKLSVPGSKVDVRIAN
jgi:preprotein translocase subunit SecD